jgi:hypothetical protein
LWIEEKGQKLYLQNCAKKRKLKKWGAERKEDIPSQHKQIVTIYIQQTGGNNLGR